MALPGGLLGGAGHAPRALVLLAATGVGGRGSQGQPLLAGQRLEVVDQAVVAVQKKQHTVPTTPVPLGARCGGRGSTPARPSTGSAATRRRRPPRPALRSSKAPRCRRSSRGGAGRRSPPPRRPERAVSPRGGVRGGSSRGRRRGPSSSRSSSAPPGEPLDPEAVGEDAPHEAVVLRVPDGLLLGQGLGQLLPAASRLVGRRGRGHVGQLLRGRGQQIGKRERSSATSNFVLMAAIMVVLVVYGRARQQDLEDLSRVQAAPRAASALGACGSSRGTARTALRWLLFCPGSSQRVGGAALQVQRSEELSGGLVQLLARLLKPLQSGEGCAFGSQQDRQPLSDLLADELLLHLEELLLDLGQRRDIARADAALPQGLALLAERFHRRPALLLALLGHGGSCAAAGRALVQALAKLKLQVLRPLQHLLPVQDVDLLRQKPASEPSAISRSSTGAPRASSSCRRLTSSREAPRFSALASTAAFSTGLSCSRRSRTWVAILNFPGSIAKGSSSKSGCQLHLPTSHANLSRVTSPTSHANLSRVASPANFSCQLVESYFTC